MHMSVAARGRNFCKQSF